MASTPNNTANVSTGKGVAGGYFFLAPLGTTLPTDNSTPLDAAFLNMGFLGEDGVSFSDSSDATNFFDLNGDTVDVSNGSIEKTFTVTFIEIKKDSLAVLRGSANVTDNTGLITAYDKGFNDTEYVGCLELLLKNGRKWRRVVPQCKTGELGDMTITYSELVGRETTFNVIKDPTTGSYYIDYIDSTETEAA